MSVPAPERTAVVVAAIHDRPTRVVAEGARRAFVSLQKADYAVLPFFGNQATFDRIDVDLRECRIQRPQARLSFGLFSAHGSDKGLHQAPHPGLPEGAVGEELLDVETCRQFEEAILVFLSCTCTGDFPDRVIGLNPAPQRPRTTPVRAVIAYRGLLQVPPKSLFLKSTTLQTYDRFQAILAAHVRLLLRGYSVQETCTLVRRMWAERKGLPRALRLAYANNEDALDCWPKNSDARFV